MPLTWTPPKAPSVGDFSQSVRAAVNRVEFSDGYAQRSPEGVNTLRRTVRLTFANLTTGEKNLVQGFLVARAGVESFVYQLPGETAMRLWTASSWSISPVPSAANRWNVSAELLQEFDLG
jgi:phage-related protein